MSEQTICPKHGLYYGICHTCRKENQDRFRQERLDKLKAENKALDFKIIREENLPTAIRTDPTRLRQCLINLIDNAVKFTKEGLVHVTVSQQEINDNPFVRFDVEDTGIGISEEALGRIFEEFQQADSTTRQQYGGTGLGLSISRSLARLLGGDLTATSVNGQGSNFTLKVPLHYEVAKEISGATYPE